MQLFPNGLAKTLLPQGTQGLSAALQTASPFLLGMSQGVREGTPWRGANVGLANMMVAQEREQAEAEKRREAAEKQQALALSRGMLSDIFQPAAPVDASNPFAVTEPQGIANATMAALGREPMAGSALPASLVQSESGGRFSAMNDVPGAGGVGHFGRGQFSRARLNEAMAAGVIPQGMTPEQFLQSPEAQQRVEAWHVQDVGNFIREQGLDRYIGQTINGTMITPSGMLAVAHLGGKEGLRRFIETGGQYNPADANGTSLMDYMRQHGGGREPINPDRAAAILTSPHVPAAVKQMVMQQMQGPSQNWEVREVDGRLARVDAGTGQVEYLTEGGPAQADPEEIQKVRKEFSGLAPVKDFAAQSSAYGRIVAAARAPSAAGDLAMIFNYMKLLDPGSVVREGEFATAETAAGVPDRVRNIYNRVLTGERLGDEQRFDFLDRAERIYSSAEQGFDGLYQQYAGIAQAAGMPLDQALIDFRYQGPRASDVLDERQQGAGVADDAMRVLQGAPAAAPVATPPMQTPPRPVQLDDGRQYSPEQVSAAAAKLTPGQRATFERMTGLPDMIEYLRRVGALQ
jgi:hypothetical protein